MTVFECVGIYIIQNL